MKYTIKKSESTDKLIVVVNGRVKVGEVLEGKIIATGRLSDAQVKTLSTFARKNNLTLVFSTQRGGHREGSGRKPMYEEKTKVISFRVPESKEEEVKDIVGKFLKTT